MEITNLGIISGIILGAFGSVFSVVQFFYQRHKDREQVARERELEAKQATRERELEERQAARQQEMEARQAAQQAELEAKQDLKDRLAFLIQVIIDKDIPRESRQPFFDEYIAKGGNGSVVRFWLQNK